MRLRPLGVTALCALLGILAACEGGGFEASPSPEFTFDSGSFDSGGPTDTPPPDDASTEASGPTGPACADAAGTACYDGPAGTRGVGACRDGILRCSDDGAVTCEGEVLPAVKETCNVIDDDCNGTVDDGFDLTTSNTDCGMCGHACAADEHCSASTCFKDAEISCTNNVDDDGDGKIDCADSDCDTKACGAGCVCKGLVKTETICNDNVDNDGDGKTDCADADCDAAACGTGCVCKGLMRTETICNDGVDNDADGKIDCADADCEAKPCKRVTGAPGTCKGGTCS